MGITIPVTNAARGHMQGAGKTRNRESLTSPHPVREGFPQEEMLKREPIA